MSQSWNVRQKKTLPAKPHQLPSVMSNKTTTNRFQKQPSAPVFDSRFVPSPVAPAQKNKQQQASSKVYSKRPKYYRDDRVNEMTILLEVQNMSQKGEPSPYQHRKQKITPKEEKELHQVIYEVDNLSCENFFCEEVAEK